MPDDVFYAGRRYRVGGDLSHVAHPLPDWFPALTPLAWRETKERFGQDRAYSRVYRNAGEGLLVLASCAVYGDGVPWLHVSVSRRDRKIPTWEQMSQVKRVFVGDNRTALQVMPPKHQWVNIHPGCLHLYCCLTHDVTPDFTAGYDTI